MIGVREVVARDAWADVIVGWDGAGLVGWGCLWLLGDYSLSQ